MILPREHQTISDFERRMNITNLAKRLCLPVLLLITPAAFAAEHDAGATATGSQVLRTHGRVQRQRAGREQR
jgi:hypothetical protein